MNLFINDKPIIITTFGGLNFDDYDNLIDGGEFLTSKKLKGKVVVKNASVENIERLLRILEIKKLRKLKHITFLVADKKIAKQAVKDQFKIVKAGGGVVEKDDKILLIFRQGKWDLPKGKLKKKEKFIKGALREVEEECSVKVEAQDKICTTYHNYKSKGKKILKKIKWYRMSCKSDKKMKPQIEEDIEDVRWMSREEVEEAMGNTYMSIKEVLDRYWRIDHKI